MRRSSSRRSSRNKVEAEETVESTDRRNSKVLRRRSVANGETTDRVAKLVFDPPLPPLTSTPSGLTSDKNDLAKELAENLIENIQASANIDVKILAWLDFNEFIEKVTADKELLKAFMLQLCRLLAKPLKLARNGLGVRLLISLACTYSDMISDLLMLRFYKDTGDHKSYDASLKILIGAMSAHVINSLSQNKHCSLKIRAVRVLQTLFLLNPVVYTFGKWSGKAKEEGAAMNSNQLLMFTKLIEMIFEALPQLILQVGALMRADSISLLPVASICLSVATAGFLIADLSVGMERGFMTDQFRGPHTAKWCGILPLNFEWVFFLGHMMLVSGYFAAHVLALTVGGLVLPGYAIPAYMVGEWGLFLFWGWKYGRARWFLGTSNRLGLFDVLRPEWAVMSFVPIMFIGSPLFLGGRTFAGWIAYKLMLTTTFVVQVCTSGGGLVESIKLSSGSIMTLQLVAAVCAVVGFLLMVRFASDSHRHLLFKTIMTPKELYQRHFTTDDYPLDWTYNTRDEAKMNEFGAFHPYYFTESKAKVQEWLLGLRSSDDLFSSGAVVPNGVYAFKGQQWSTVFTRVKYHFAYFKDDGANRLITTHLDNLLGEIESRPIIITPSPAQVPVPAPAHTKDEQIELLKEQLAASRAENEELKLQI